jgi:hypothetical protein
MRSDFTTATNKTTTTNQQHMKLRFSIDQAAAFAAGINAPTSVTDIEVNPGDLSVEERVLIAEYLQGIEVREDMHTGKLIVADSPDLKGLLAAVKAKAQEKQAAIFAAAIKAAEAEAEAERLRSQIRIFAPLPWNVEYRVYVAANAGDGEVLEPVKQDTECISPSYEVLKKLHETPEWKRAAEVANGLTAQAKAEQKRVEEERKQKRKELQQARVNAAIQYLEKAGAEELVEMHRAKVLTDDGLLAEVEKREREEYNLADGGPWSTFSGDLIADEYREIKAQLAKMPKGTTYKLYEDRKDVEAEFKWKVGVLEIAGYLILRVDEEEEEESYA